MDLNELDKICNEKFNLPSDYSCTRNIAQAWGLLERFSGHYFMIKNESVLSEEITASLCNFKNPEVVFATIAETAPLAITKACLKAVGVEVE